MSEEKDSKLCFNVGDTMMFTINCIKCNRKEGLGCVTFGGQYNMCNDCANEFQNWMYSKLVKEWLTKGVIDN